MTTSLADIKRAIGKRTTPPTDSPTLISANDLEPLGTAAGRDWFRHPRYGELRERPATLTDDDLLPSKVLVQTIIDGERRYRVFDAFDVGTLEGIRATPAPTPPRAKPSRPADRLNRYPILTKQASQGLGSYRVRGCVDILDRLAAKDHRVGLDSTGRALWWTTPGLVPPGLPEDLSPLLVPFLRDGIPPRCTAPTGHPDGVDDEAVSPVDGGGLACAWHLGGAA